MPEMMLEQKSFANLRRDRHNLIRTLPVVEFILRKYSRSAFIVIIEVDEERDPAEEASNPLFAVTMTLKSLRRTVSIKPKSFIQGDRLDIKIKRIYKEFNRWPKRIRQFKVVDYESVIITHTL